MATQEKTIALSGLARTLVRGSYIDQEKAEELYKESQEKKTPFINLVIENKLVSSSIIASASAKEFGMSIVSIDLVDIDLDVVKLVSPDLIKKHTALPIFKRGNRLTVAVSDPTNVQALDEMKFATSLNAQAVVVEADKLLKDYDSGNHDCLSIDLPKEVRETKWDVIIVDAPAAWDYKYPCRMKSIYEAYNLAKNSEHIDIFVHSRI